MTNTEGDDFARAILDRVAELAYEELRPHLDRWAREQQADRGRTHLTTPATGNVASLHARRRRAT
ncbi:hypothetical protein [Planosporangium mesophilum]|uniref:Transposase n=1 Tax=Planosporangium mesophilum TaxID=689768 RepID=A0A8J3X0B6_9ACTN|nr:hypothetical protein [Planosporangium mesophilum]NJC82128.1 hypothetical protein [Planosporangium mesophilum]GII22174.1 hypothetical protein Pme01_17710 [Planosporangium mesophilum]